MAITALRLLTQTHRADCAILNTQRRGPSLKCVCALRVDEKELPDKTLPHDHLTAHSLWRCRLRLCPRAEGCTASLEGWENQKPCQD